MGGGGGGGGGLAGLGYDYRECEDIPVAIQSLACNSVLPFRLGCRLSWDAIVGLCSIMGFRVPEPTAKLQFQQRAGPMVQQRYLA